MVNFNQKLQNNIYVEWSDHYVDYKRLKKILKKWKQEGQPQDPEQSPLLSSIDGSARRDHFRQQIEKEMKKVEKCYIERLSEYESQLELLQQQYHDNMSESTENSLHDACVELYRLLSLLVNFALLNYTGFVKIIKKYDKQAPFHPLKAEMTQRYATVAFPDPATCHALVRQLENFFADSWCEGNIPVARASLLVKKEDGVKWDEILMVGPCVAPR